MDDRVKVQEGRLESHLLFKEILDTLPEHICVLSLDGTIVYVNRAWLDFAKGNCASESLIGVGINYLQVCDASAERGDTLGQDVATAIRNVVSGESLTSYIEYPCHSPTEQRWFMMRVSRLGGDTSNYILVDHHNITERKLAELEVQTQARLDSLTSLANRRYFGEFSSAEWRRSIRKGSRVVIAMLDCDHFKVINDRYGHQVGDQLLQLIADSLKQITRRPGDLAVRYGGDEFLIFQNDMSAEESRKLLSGVVQKVNRDSVKLGIESVTLSIGIAEQIPVEGSELNDLIAKADAALYQAKHSGKDRIFIASGELEIIGSERWL